MRNFPVIVDGVERWISRSIAAAGFIFTVDDGLRVLAVKRGRGCPTDHGKWCCPCGYLDYDETIEEACRREIREETNLNVSSFSLNLFEIDDSPKSERQTVSFLYWSYSDKYSWQTVTSANSEPDEIDDIEWIRIDELDKYDWAFDHKRLIISVALQYLDTKLSESDKTKILNGVTKN